MAATGVVDIHRAERAARLLRRVGHWGALLTLAVLAASMLMRLTTAIDAEGAARSGLPEAIEAAARLGHRLAAMGVSVLALLAAMIAFTTRPAPPGRLVAVALVLALTVFLAVLGRYTPGYRAAIVTVGNVVGGIGLACAFWWLRERSSGIVPIARSREAALAWLAFAALVAQSGLGAATSALAMHGQRTLDPLHLAMGIAFAAFAALAAWPHRRRPGSARLALAVVLLVAFQFALGLFLASAVLGRPWPLAWTHAMGACALAIALTALAARSRG